MKRFEMKPEHVTLLRCAYVRWETGETGAPAIDCKRPYGNSWVEMDVAETLGWDISVDQFESLYLTKEQDDLATQLHRETATALQVILATGSFEPGEYEASDYGNDWRRTSDGL